MIAAAPIARTSRRRRAVARPVAAAVVALLALSACTSDPGPSRVARDVIEAETVINPDITDDERDCMFEALEDNYTDADLEEISDQANDSDQAAQDEAQAELAKLRATIGACLS